MILLVILQMKHQKNRMAFRYVEDVIIAEMAACLSCSGIYCCIVMQPSSLVARVGQYTCISSMLDHAAMHTDLQNVRS